MSIKVRCIPSRYHERVYQECYVANSRSWLREKPESHRGPSYEESSWPIPVAGFVRSRRIGEDRVLTNPSYEESSWPALASSSTIYNG